MSMASRVTAVCAALLCILLSIVLFCVHAGEQVRRANLRTDLLIRTLRAQDHADTVQRQLRLAIGDATRGAEQRRGVSAVRWETLIGELRAFAALSSRPDMAPAADAPPAVRSALATTRTAAMRFIPICRRLIDVARRDPSAIRTEMPGFLHALTTLEAGRNDAREALGQAIERSVDDGIDLTRRTALWLLGSALGFMLSLLAATVWLRMRVIAPITRIAARIREFDADRSDARAVPGLDRADELGDLARGLSDYCRVVEERRVTQRHIDFLAHNDALTGLPNRLMFEQRLRSELARRRRTGDGVAVLAIDMDGFKEINDRHGHAGGDEALRRAARMLAESARTDDLVARIGGDEFAIIQAGSAQPQGATALLARLAAAMADTAHDDIPIRMSIGVAIASGAEDDDALHGAADIALYRAKAEGGNAARFYDLCLQEELRTERRLGRDLEHAIERDELYVVFQPIATADRRLVGYEALLRWRHPELGEISPGQFIPIAEATGQIGRIGRWMADRAIAAAAGWDDRVALSINLSPIQFREPDLTDMLLHTAARHGVAPDRLEFEVTESATLLGHHRDTVLNALLRLQDAGGRIAMDDFGTGHSSLSNLKDFRFDRLKIDRSFVAAMLVDPPSASIIRATIGLGRSLGAAIVAEGVESEPQFDQLRAWGCDLMQGYLIGYPERTAAPPRYDERRDPEKAAVPVGQVPATSVP